MLKRTTPFGEIRLIEVGNGYADNERYFTSDQQLYYFLLLSEYLRVTNDYDFLCEKIQPYPAKNQTKMMAISILQTLIPELKNAADKLSGLAAQLDKLCRSMKLYRENILRAYLNDMGERKFPRRMYFNGKPYGDDNMFLEPQGFTLQIDELPENRKLSLYEEMVKRIYQGEKLGAREQEKPEFEDEGFDKGSRENGGFWWALNGPVIIGVSQFDKNEAARLLKNMTLQHLSEEFPQYW